MASVNGNKNPVNLLFVKILWLFLKKKIKVNYRYDWGFIHPAQSEIISVGLIVVGAFILLMTKKVAKKV